LIAAVAFAADLSTECEYVDSNRYLTNVDYVKKCFETYKTDEPSHIINAIIMNLDIIKEIYPYVDIASNPPNNPPGYFKVVNYTSAFEELKKDLKNSGGVVSKIIRPTMKFVKAFHDGHFSFSINYDSVAGGILSPIYFVLPFAWDAENDERQVFIKPNSYTNTFIYNGSQILRAKYNAGLYATKVDGRDALEFFADYLGEYNDMKSKQGTLIFSMMAASGRVPLLVYPVENIFDTHKITFSDGSELSYKNGFMNLMHSGRRDNSLELKGVAEKAVNEQEVIAAIRNFKRVKREKREEENDWVQCGMIDNMNYVSIQTFSPRSVSMFLDELLGCIEQFDENDKPITVILPENGGGSTALREVVQFLLMPTSDSRTIRAIRKTRVTRAIALKDLDFVTVTNDECRALTPFEMTQFWEETEKDDLGNGVIHTRTKKYVESFKDSFYPFADHTFKKNIRKPTDIIVATDGYCFSSCAFFVDNCIRSGSAIVTGYGVTMPGDELFAAAQCPSRVYTPSNYYQDLNDVNNYYGISFTTTFSESFNFSKNMKEVIPTDYDILRIDKHCGYLKNRQPVFSDLLKKTTEVYEEFKTKCNPANKRLLYVTDECSSSDKNALYSGYMCGSNGEWDKKKCRISGCKPGYVVDFDNDKCVPNPCDPRSASSGLYPMISVLLATISILIHFVL